MTPTEHQESPPLTAEEEAAVRRRDRDWDAGFDDADWRARDLLNDRRRLLATLDAARTDREGPGAAGLREALIGLVSAVIAMKHAIPPATALGELWRPFLARTGDVNLWLDEAEAALRAPVAGERGDDANRECATCGDPIYCPSCASEASR